MANQRETSSYDIQFQFTEALATARNMQQDWLNYGLDFVHLYVEDAKGDWLETWGNDEIIDSSLLDAIKEYLVSDDDVAVRVRQRLEERVSNFTGSSYTSTLTLFDIAVNLEEYWRIPQVDKRLSAVKNLLVGDRSNRNLNPEIDDIELLHLADSLLEKLADIL
jgi:hypothetical protein